jgi:hypothetical protein
MYALKIACWALIFIFRLRFPPGISIAKISLPLGKLLNGMVTPVVLFLYVGGMLPDNLWKGLTNY